MEQVERPSYLSKTDELLATRYCEPSKMEAPERYNEVDKTSLDYCVQGTYTVEGYKRGAVDTRWQTVQDLVDAGCSRENFEKLTKAHVKDLQTTFKRDAKRFKSAAQLAEEAEGE